MAKQSSKNRSVADPGKRSGVTGNFRPYDDLEVGSFSQGKGIAAATEEQNWGVWERTKIALMLAGMQDPDGLTDGRDKSRLNMLQKIIPAIASVKPQWLVEAIRAQGISVLPGTEWKRQMGIQKLDRLRAAAELRKDEPVPQLSTDYAYDMLTKDGVEVISDEEAELQFAHKVIDDLVSGRSYIPRSKRGSTGDMARHKDIESNFLGTGTAYGGYNPVARPGTLQTITGLTADRNFDYRPSRNTTRTNPRYTSFKQPYTSPNKTPWAPQIDSPADEKELIDMYKDKVGHSKFKESVDDTELLQRWRELEAKINNQPLFGRNGKVMTNPQTGQPIKNSIIGKRLSPEEQQQWDLPAMSFTTDRYALGKVRPRRK
jgi:hypothetical protein